MGTAAALIAAGIAVAAQPASDTATSTPAVVDQTAVTADQLPLMSSENEQPFDLASLADRSPDFEQPTAAPPPHSAQSSSFLDHGRAIRYETGAVALGITALGVVNWNWGSSGFRFQSEGWFGRDTSSFGMDKLGHAYSTYVISEFLGASLRRNAPGSRRGQVSAAALSMALMTYVELFDGFSVDHGFSWEDLVADAAGAGFSVLRHEVPGLNDKLDFRLHYLPSRHSGGWHPITDYAGQRYVLALKLAGFDKLERGPLRFVELQGGYYARGFTRSEKERGVAPKRALFVGVGFNVQQLLSRRRGGGSPLAQDARSVLEYVQLPYTATYSR